ncbi:MAG: tetratricopeptide repeat protein [Nocardioides sp.]
MSSTSTPLAHRVAGGEFLQSLDLPTAIAAEESREASPGMLTSAERAMLSEIVRRTWRGDGAIVDGGSFLGSSLVAEARGMAASSVLAELSIARFPGGKPIHGYELGYHPAPASPATERRRTYGGVEYQLGESFVPMLERTIAPHRDLIDLHVGDLMEMDWGGHPVELAFIDVCKTSDLNAHVSRVFYPALIGGASTLIHQDFFFDRLPWIRVTMGYLADYFRWEGQVASSSVFTSVKAVPKELAGYDPYTEGTLEECLAYHDVMAFPGIDRTAQLMLALSRVHLILHKGSRDHALEHLQDLAVEYVDILGAVSQAGPYQPTPGSPETMLPRYRMDRAISEVLRGDAKAPKAASGASPPRPGRVSKLDRAKAALSRGDWDEARQALEPLRTAEPSGPATFLLARTELESGHPDVAAALLDDLLSRRPRHERARALRAQIHLIAGDPTRARAEAEEALRTAPGLAVARRVLFDVSVAERLGG